jgi:murein DD-endopeptidase MepM/ murein hydrolase activator NlpD
MQKILWLFGWLLPSMLVAQEFKIYTEKTPSNITLFYVDNDYPCKQSLKIVFDKVVNICPSNSQHFFIEPLAKRKFLFSVRPCNTDTVWSYHYRYWRCAGDTTLSEYDKKFAYNLPYPKGVEYKVSQGYFGTYSHQDEYAIDFKMPEGSAVCAMRGGIIINTKSDSNIGGGNRKYIDEGNFVLIYHDDGTLASYYHFQQNGVVVQIGEKVTQGQLIGYSGNTGFSSGPHLHVEVRLPYFTTKKTIETKFKIGGKLVTLEEGIYYKNED